ncbi:MAG: GGDEF domain-containing protein [Lachnospiraceae bacterium]|nr:GGDEF domain-containing protein [Lachnospiraceae bacterium]
MDTMNGILNLKNKIVGLITKDTTVESESVKILIVVRVLLLSVMACFFANLIITWEVLDTKGYGFCLLFFLGSLGLMLLTYRVRVRLMAYIFTAGMLLFIWFNLIWFGWWIGVQHFLIPILVMLFFVGYDRYVLKMWLAAALCLLRILLYFRFHTAQSLYEIPGSREDALQIINTITIFWCLTVISYVFGKTSREMEGKLVKYNEKLEKEALTDNLTGLANRRRAMDYIQQLLQEGHTDSFSLCICDIDFFKKVNDTWGHDCGDIVLKRLGALFREEMKNGNMPCRWGGEEFLLLFPGSNGDEARVILMKIRDRIKDMVVEYEGDEIRITMTFGLTEFDFTKDVEYSIAEADEKLYYGKNHGRNQIVF